MDNLLLLAFILLSSGIAIVPISVWLGFGSVLGFLFAGILLGPVFLALNVDIEGIEHFAEFGVVMMMFLIGLELAPRKLWNLRRRLLGLGGLQMIFTTVAIMSLAMVMGQQWRIALTIGLILSLSSTAIVLQAFHEKGIVSTSAGQSSIAVLLLQDIAVIPILALLPMLSPSDLVTAVEQGVNQGPPVGTEMSLDQIQAFPEWLKATATLSAIALVILVGSFLTQPVFRYVETANLPELFTAMALAIVLGVAILMMIVGLTSELGAFVAGVVLANNDHRQALEKEILPFKGLFLGLFFVSVGASVNFSLLLAHIGTVLGLTIGVMSAKVIILSVLGRCFGVSGANNWLFALGMAQAGEFGFVLLSFSVAKELVTTDLADLLILVVVLSMVMTPLILKLYERLVAPLYETRAKPAD